MAKQKAVSEAKTFRHKMAEPRFAGWVIFAIGFMVYANTITNDYNMDDELVTRNHRLTKNGLSAIPGIFREPYYKDDAGYSYEYRPVVLTSFAIEHQFFGENPHISHFINVLLYAVSCMLLFAVLAMLMTDFSPWLTLFVALLFAVHPIHTEVVASIKNRDELLAFVFGLAAWRSLLRYADQKQWPNLALLPVWFLLSLLAKQDTSVLLLLVPTSLVLFRKGPAWLPFVACLLMAVVLFPVLNTPEISTKVMVVLAALLTVFILSFRVRQWLQLVDLKRWYGIGTGRRNEAHPEVPDSDTDAPLIPDHKILRSPGLWLTVLLPALVLFALGLWAVLYAQIVWIAAALTGLGLLMCLAKPEVTALVFVPYALLLLLITTVAAFIPQFVPLNVLLTGTVMAMQRKSTLRYIFPFTGLLATGAFAIYFLPFTLLLFLAAILVFRYAENIYLKWSGPSLMLAFSVYFIYQTFSGGSSASYYFLLILPLWSGLALVIFRGFNFRWIPLISLATVVLAFAFYGREMSFPNNFEDVRSAIIRANREAKVSIAPSAENRPLALIETPVNHLSPMSERIGTASVILLRYLKLVVIPYPMAFYYGYREISATGLADPAAIAGYATYAALLSLLLFFLARKFYLPAFGLLFYLIPVVSFSNLFIAVPGMMADRFLFLPSLGFCIFLVWLLCAFSTRRVKQHNAPLPPGLRYIFTAILVLAALLTWSRNADWKDHLTLFRKDIKVVPESAQAQNLLALQLYAAGLNAGSQQERVRLGEEAIPHFRKALQIHPEFLNASFDLGRTYAMLGRQKEAYEAFERTIRIDTNFIAPCFDMGIYQQNLGNLAAAIKWYERFLSRYPAQKEAYANLSFAYFKMGAYSEAIEVNKRALVHLSEQFEPLVNIGKTYYTMKQTDSALHYMQRALELRPADINLRNNIADIKARQIK